MFSSHAMLPGSQESREFCLPGGHPTWVEGTGAKEEKVSAGWVQVRRQDMEHRNGLEKQAPGQ